MKDNKHTTTTTKNNKQHNKPQNLNFPPKLGRPYPNFCKIKEKLCPLPGLDSVGLSYKVTKHKRK